MAEHKTAVEGTTPGEVFEPNNSSVISGRRRFTVYITLIVGSIVIAALVARSAIIY